MIFSFLGATSASTNASGQQQDCPFQGVFCVPARYFQNNPDNAEWLDYLPEAPLPSDIKRQLKQDGAVCGFDPITEMDVMCDVNSTVQGRLFEKNGIGDGKGLAYDVSDDGMTVTTIALDQFDNSVNPLNCFSDANFASCSTFSEPVFAEPWVREPDGTYTRGAATPGFFVFTSGVPPGH